MNAKQGDMVIVINAFDPGFIGMVGEVISAALSVSGPGWIVEFPRHLLWEDAVTGLKGYGNRFIIPDAWIRPITGLPLNEETHDEVTA